MVEQVKELPQRENRMADSNVVALGSLIAGPRTRLILMLSQRIRATGSYRLSFPTAASPRQSLDSTTCFLSNFQPFF